MPNNYDFLDAHSSVLTARSSVTAGTAHEPYVTVTSVLSAIPVVLSGNSSISGTVGASIIGMSFGADTQVSVTSSPNIDKLITINRNYLFSNAAGFWDRQRTVENGTNSTGTGITAVGLIGQYDDTTPSGVTENSFSNLRISSVRSLHTTIRDAAGNERGANVDAANALLVNTAGSVLAQQSGTRTTSVFSSIPSSLLTGTYGHRNDTVASFLGGDLSWRPIATDSAGRTLIRPFAAEESRVEGYGSTVNVSQTTLVAAAGAGLRNYITDLWFANTGAAATLVTLKDGGGSILGYTIAPAGSGSNLPGLQTPIRTGANVTFDFQATTGTSVLYATVKGFKAP